MVNTTNEKRPSIANLNSIKTIEKLIFDWKARKRKNSVFVHAKTILEKEETQNLNDEKKQSIPIRRLYTDKKALPFAKANINK